MIRFNISIIALMAAGLALAAECFDNILLDEATLRRSCNELTIDADMCFKDLKLKSTESLILTPVLTSETDTLLLPSIGVYGKRNYLFYIRNNGVPLTGHGEKVFQLADLPDSLRYSQTVRYQPWMDGSELTFRCMTFGCCNRILSDADIYAGSYQEFHPIFLYQKPSSQADKIYQLSGRAYIEFPVNQTVIYPDYRNNETELGKICQTIDSVKDDSDISITGIWLKGYASPESPYANNERLARGRVSSLKNYLQQLYNFPDSAFATAYEPEDWEGLRKFVSESSFKNRDSLLSIIDMNMAPDEKEAKIKRDFPNDYRNMLDNWFPALRHTDYKIEYQVRDFYDPKEIAQVMSEAPQKLTLNELYVLSNYYEEGTPEYNEVFETAARLFPNDETPNLNAAVNAMRRGDLVNAEKYLSKAGVSPQADYAKGLLAVLRQDYAQGIQCLQKAAEAGIAEAEIALEYVHRSLHLKTQE